MRERLVIYQEMYGDLYNLEATPAESTAYRLAKHDKKEYKDIITANDDSKVPYYTNSSHLPVSFTDDVFRALDIEDRFQNLYTSGTVFHTFLGEKLPDWRAAASLVKKIATNYKLPYYTISPTYSICEDHGYLTGEVYTCPICGKKTEVWSRITGYYRPISNWNDGKAQEFKDRVEYLPNDSTVLKAKEVEDEIVKEEAKCEYKPSELTIFVQDHCPKCKGTEQRLKLKGISYNEINCSKDTELARKLGVVETPTIIDTDGKWYAGANAAVDYLKDHE